MYSWIGRECVTKSCVRTPDRPLNLFWVSTASCIVSSGWFVRCFQRSDSALDKKPRNPVRMLTLQYVIKLMSFWRGLKLQLSIQRSQVHQTCSDLYKRHFTCRDICIVVSIGTFDFLLSVYMYLTVTLLGENTCVCLYVHAAARVIRFTTKTWMDCGYIYIYSLCIW